MAAAAAGRGAGGAAVDLGRGLDEVLDARRLPLGPGRLRRHAQLPRPAPRPARARAAVALLSRRPRQCGLRVGGAVLRFRPHAPARALERTRRGPVRGAGVRCFPTAARRALRLPRCLDTDGLLAGCAAAASNHAGPRRGHAGCAECGRHSCRWRQVMVAADIFRPFPPRALAWLRQRPAVSTELLALLASVFFTVACNYELWHTLVADIQADARLLAAVFVFVTALQAFLLGLVLSRSEEHTSELQSLMRISYAVFCLKKKTAQQYISYTQSC